MGSKLLTLVSAFSLLVGTVVVETAHAGPLGQTARAVDNKTSSSDSNNNNDSDDSSTSDRDDDDSFDSNFGSNTRTSLLPSNYCFDCDESLKWKIPTPTGHARAAGQKVRDSDGSFRFDASVVFGKVGAYASADYYFEHIEAKGVQGLMEEDVRVNLIELAPMVRFYDEGPLTADLRLGLSVAASSHFDTLPGGVIGVRLLAQASDRLTSM